MHRNLHDCSNLTALHFNNSPQVSQSLPSHFSFDASGNEGCDFRVKAVGDEGVGRSSEGGRAGADGRWGVCTTMSSDKF